MSKPDITRTHQADHAQFTFHNGERATSKHRGGLIEIVDLPDVGKTRVDIYRTDPGVRVNVSPNGDTDDYGRVLATVTRAMLESETDRPQPTKADYWRHIETALYRATGRCVVTGDADCKRRGCELHYMRAPLALAPDLNTTYEGRQISQVIELGADPDTGGRFHVKVTGRGDAATHWMSANEDQLRRIAVILAENRGGIEAAFLRQIQYAVRANTEEAES